MRIPLVFLKTIISVFFLGIFLICACDSDNDGEEVPVPGEFNNAGTPYGLTPPDNPKSTLEIKFIVAGDPQFVDVGNTSDRITRQRTVADDIDIHENTDSFMGIVMAGDLVDSDKYYHMTAFRQVYENDYPGHDPGCIAGDCALIHTGSDCSDMYKYYSGNAHVDSAVYPLLGNHDHDEDSFAWNYVVERMGYSDALFKGKDHNGDDISNWFRINYAWEWGSYHCISLGEWAFAKKGFGSEVDWEKVDWLKTHLSQIGKEKPIILFQHYGFDWFSRDDWWTYDDRKLLINVICDQDQDHSDWPCYDPYNVVALFTGHKHSWDYIPDILYGQGPRKIPNFVVDDAGFEHCDASAQCAGYYFVRIEMNDNDQTATMHVDKRIFFGDGTLKDYNSDDCKWYIADQDWDRYWHRDEHTVTFSPPFLRFEQGEPNNDHGSEDCAEMKSWGRYNDTNCSNKGYILCYDSRAGAWHITSDTYEWKEGFDQCVASGWVFREPKSVAEQRDVIQLIQDNGGHNVWVNYTDLLHEGRWKQGPEYLKYFDKGEPNNGEQFFERGWGQNCAAALSNGKIDDMNCEMNLDKYLCRNATGDYYVKKHIGAWIEGYDLCDSWQDYACDPGDFGSAISAAQSYWKDHPDDDDPIWIGASDMDEEGTWDKGYPWLWKDDNSGRPGRWYWGEPNNGDGGFEEDCAIMRSNCWWNDVPCENYNDNMFACRNYETGAWMSSTMTSRNWIDGFEACRKLGLRWHFATPIRDLDWSHFCDAVNSEIWLNYTDADSAGGEDMEGHWRHGFWTNWNAGEPNNMDGNENCASSMSAFYGGQWNDLACDRQVSVLCRTDENSEAGGAWIFQSGRTYREAQSQCANIEKGATFKFTYPTCPSEQEEVNALSIKKGTIPFWIQLNDQNREGMFQPWGPDTR